MTYIYDMDGSKGGGLVAQVKNSQIQTEVDGYTRGGGGHPLKLDVQSYNY